MNLRIDELKAKEVVSAEMFYKEGFYKIVMVELRKNEKFEEKLSKIIVSSNA